MLLTPGENDRLLLYTAAQLARSRRARGLRLNVPEAVAIIADTVAEVARDGGRHSDALDAGRAALTVDDVLAGVPEIVTEVKVEAVFDDGTRLVIVPRPIGPGAGEVSVVAGAPTTDGVPVAHPPGAVLPAGPPPEPAGPDPAADVPPGPTPEGPGAEAGAGAGPAEAGLAEVEVVNTAPVPVSVSSHFHFFEANPRLRFDRAASYGRHLAVASGSTVRFDPGVRVRVRLAPFGGERVVVGFSGLVDGPLDAPGAREQALARARLFGYLDLDDPADSATGGGSVGYGPGGDDPAAPGRPAPGPGPAGPA